MKTNWQIKKLLEVIVENKKSTLKSKGNNRGKYPFFVSGFNIKSIDKYLIDEKSIFLPTGGNFFVHYFEGRSAYSTDTWSIKTTTDVDVKFLYYFLVLQSDFIGDKLFKGATIKHLQKNDFKNIKIQFPYILEQKRIVKMLDDVFEKLEKAKENTEKNLKNSKELFESFLHIMFNSLSEDWKDYRLCDVYHIGSSKRIYETEWTSSGVPFFGGKEIVKLAKVGTVVSNAYISEEKYQEYLSKYDMPIEGDILMTARGTIGVCYIVKKDDKFYYKDGNIISFRKKISISPQFFIYAFKSQNIIKQIKNLSGTTVKHLPIEKAKDIIIKLPDLETQKTIVKKLDQLSDKIKKLESLQKKKLRYIEELKKSILQKAFSGEL